MTDREILEELMSAIDKTGKKTVQAEFMYAFLSMRVPAERIEILLDLGVKAGFFLKEPDKKFTLIS